MKIALISSVSFFKETVEVGNRLEKLGHSVILPHNFENYAKGKIPPEKGNESTAKKIENDLIRQYFNEIKNSDAVLIVNKSKNNIENYIGGNGFLEMGFAHVLNKKIFLLNSVPNMQYSDEILAMEYTVINNDLTKIN